jgi:hypothetical protein
MGRGGAPNIWVKAPTGAAGVAPATAGASAADGAMLSISGGTDGAPNICVNTPGAAGAGAAATGGAGTGGGTAGMAAAGVTGRRVAVSCNCSIRGRPPESSAAAVESGSTGSIGPPGCGAGGAGWPNIIVKAPGSGADGATLGGSIAGGATGAGASAGSTGAAAATDSSSRAGDAGPALRESHAGKEASPAMNSVTMANPDGNVAVSSTRFLSAPVNRANCCRRRSASSGPAASARCTITTRPVANSCALCVRMPSSTATHLSRRYRALKSSLMLENQPETGV